MSDRYAIISVDTVQMQCLTVVVWDGISPWEPPAGTSLVQLEENEPCGQEWIYAPYATPRFIPPVIEE